MFFKTCLAYLSAKGSVDVLVERFVNTFQKLMDASYTLDNAHNNIQYTPLRPGVSSTSTLVFKHFSSDFVVMETRY